MMYFILGVFVGMGLVIGTAIWVLVRDIRNEDKPHTPKR